MTSTGVPGLRVRSDLQLMVDDVRATLVADGQQLVFATENAGRLLARAAESAPLFDGPAASVRHLVGRLAATLDEAGLTALVTAERGTLVELGRGCESRLGALVLGSPHARLGTPAALLSAATGYVRASAQLRRPLGYGLGGLVIAALFVGAGLRRRHAVVRPEP